MCPKIVAEGYNSTLLSFSRELGAIKKINLIEVGD
jgi:hypothetical protein